MTQPLSTIEWAFWSMLICLVGPLVVAAGVAALFGLPWGHRS